jgi:hypothetical protein
MSDNSVQCISLPVVSDQKANIYKFMKLSATGVELNDSAGGVCVGVAYSNDGNAAGKVIPVAYAGVIKVIAGATVAKGAQVASTAAGLAATAVAADYVQGQALTGGDNGDLITILRVTQAQVNPS